MMKYEAVDLLDIASVFLKLSERHLQKSREATSYDKKAHHLGSSVAYSYASEILSNTTLKGK